MGVLTGRFGLTCPTSSYFIYFFFFFFTPSMLLLSVTHFINLESRLENKWINTLLHNLLSALFTSLLMNEQLKNRIIVIGDIQRDIISSLSRAAAWVCQWFHYMVRRWSLNVHSQWQCKYDRKSRKTVERNIHASQKEEHRSLLHDHSFPIKK